MKRQFKGLEKAPKIIELEVKLYQCDKRIEELKRQVDLIESTINFIKTKGSADDKLNVPEPAGLHIPSEEEEME